MGEQERAALSTSPATALRHGTGQVEAVRRDAAATGRRAWDVMQRCALDAALARRRR